MYSLGLILSHSAILRHANAIGSSEIMLGVERGDSSLFTESIMQHKTRCLAVHCLQKEYICKADCADQQHTSVIDELC